MNKKDWNFNTRAIHSQQIPDAATGAVSQKITPTVAYAFDSVDDAVATVTGSAEGTYYGRYGNETTTTLEKKIAHLEGAEDALCVSSGMAAISTALLSCLEQGDHVIVTKDVYGGTHKFLTTFAKRYGISFDYINCTDTSHIKHSIKENTKAIYIETPSNPSLTLVDISAIAAISSEFQLKLIVDNTFMTPYLQKPIECGADIVVHSATKYLNGHGDVIAGVICGKTKAIKNMRKNFMGDLGQHLSAWDAFLILRGIKTLGVRMEKHCESAMKIAEFLEAHPKIQKVYYPGLASHPQHGLAIQQMRNMGGIVSFEVKGDLETGKDFVNHLQLAMISFSLGDPETLVQHPASMTHSSIPKNELKNFGVAEGLIRLSVGLEDVDDIIHDLDQALTKVFSNEIQTSHI